MKKIYGTYRMKYTNTGVRYTPSFFLNKQFEDYHKAGLTNIKDMEIPDEMYTRELVPGVKRMTKFIVCEYNDKYIDPTELSESIARVGAEFDVSMFNTAGEARAWVDESAKELKKKEDGITYVTHESYVDENGETVPEKTLVID